MLSQDEYEKSIKIFPEDISTAFKEALRSHATFIELNKGDILISETPNNQKIYYVIQGSLTRFIITPEGNERAVMFHTENFLPNVSNIFVDSDDSEVRYLIFVSTLSFKRHRQFYGCFADLVEFNQSQKSQKIRLFKNCGGRHPLSIFNL